MICLIKNTNTEYNKIKEFVAIKTQHGVSARKSVATHHTCKEEKMSLDRNCFRDLIILLVQLTSRISRRTVLTFFMNAHATFNFT